MRTRVQSLSLLNGLRIWHCQELWCMSQRRFGSGFAVAEAQASSCSSDSTPRLGTCIYHRCGPKRTEKMCVCVCVCVSWNWNTHKISLTQNSTWLLISICYIDNFPLGAYLTVKIRLFQGYLPSNYKNVSPYLKND